MLPPSSSPWETGDDDHSPRREVRPDAPVVDVDDARPGMGAVGADAHLMAGVRTRGATVLLQGHRKQGDGHLLAGREQHVELSGAGTLLNALREAEQAVRLPAHRGDHDNDVVTPRARPLHCGGDARDALEAPDRGASEFLNDQAHDGGVMTGGS